MKKLVTSLSLAALFAIGAQADFVRVELGGGVWNADPSGDLRYRNNAPYDVADDLGYDTETQNYAWLLVKHPIPVLPNLRLEYADVSYSGKSTLSTDWMGGTYAADSVSDLSLKQYDAILYYNLLDNTFWATLDLGLDIKMFDMSYTVRDADGLATPYTESEKLYLPAGYLRGRVQIPATDLGIEADVKYISYSDSKFYDARIKVDYTLDFVPVVQPALELGYRVQKLEVEEDDIDVRGSVDFSGIYGGLMFRF